MKFRLTLGLVALVAGLAIGMSALPADAHAATAVTLSNTDRANLQAVLDLTEATLDLVQVQIDRGAIQNPSATLSGLYGIQSHLLSMRELLGGAPAPVTPQSAAPLAPAAPGPVAAAPDAPETPAAAPESPGVVAGETDQPAGEQTAPASSSSTAKRAFWIILAVAVVIAIILALPRKKAGVMAQEAHTAPAPPQQPTQEEHKSA